MRKNKRVNSAKKQLSGIRNPRIKKLVERNLQQISQTRKKLKKHKAEVEKLSNELSTFQFISHHDLQEPLRKLQLASNMLSGEEGRLSPQALGYVRIIQKSTERIHRLLADLQEYHATNTYREKKEKIDLNAVLNEVKESLADYISEMNAEIVTARLCKTTGIRYQVKKMFRDILINSLRYSRPGIPPRIVVKSRVEKAEGLPADHPLLHKRCCHISIADNGKGFDPRYSSDIFGIFRKLNPNDSGTGIGLAICKKIVDNHDGHIYAVGEPGKGATVHIFLPY